MPALDQYDAATGSLTSPADDAVAITPHNTNELEYVTRAIYIGGTGNLKLTTKNGNEVTFSSVPAGLVLPIRAKIVFATGTTATNLVALW